MPIPNDILQLVCSYTLTNVDGHNLLSALLVNKEWADVIARLVYRYISFRWNYVAVAIVLI